MAEFRRLGALKGELVLQVLRADRHVLLSDVDVIWVADPAPILRSLAVHADVMSATDCLNVTGDEAKFPKQAQGVNRCAYNPGNNHGHAAFNTGVVYLRASTAAKAFAAAWRSRLLSVEKSAWLDDQLAFNELVWHGYRNHPDKAIREASPDGKVVAIRMGVSKDDPERPTIPAHEPLPAWKDGWADPMRRPDEAFVEAKDALPAMPLGYHLAPLPARHFCSGHLFWEQQNPSREGAPPSTPRLSKAATSASSGASARRASGCWTRRRTTSPRAGLGTSRMTRLTRLPPASSRRCGTRPPIRATPTSTRRAGSSPTPSSSRRACGSTSSSRGGTSWRCETRWRSRWPPDAP